MEKRVQINTSISLSIDMLGRLECESGWVGKEHFHYFWEIIIITNDFESFEVSLVSPNNSHCFRNSLESVAHILYIGFRVDGINDLEESRLALLEKLQNKSNYEKYEAFFKDMNNYGMKDFDVSSLLPHVFTFLSNMLSEYMFEGSGDEYNGIVSKVKKYIALNIHKTLTVKEIAGTLYLSPKYIGNVFKKKTGMGILQYQKKKKMEKALSYLKSGEYSVGEVSAILGFENVAYFSNTFKNYYGISPVNFTKGMMGKIYN